MKPTKPNTHRSRSNKAQKKGKAQAKADKDYVKLCIDSPEKEEKS